MPVAELTTGSRCAKRAEVAFTPLDVVRRWPRHLPLAALVSAGCSSPWSRWSILAAPSESLSFRGHEIDRLWDLLASRSARSARGEDPVPFIGGWIVSLRYEAGFALEPAAGALPTDVVATLHRCEDALVHDNQSGQWWRVGQKDLAPGLESQPPEDREPRIAAQSPTGRAQFEDSVNRALEYIRAGDVYQVNLSHPLRAAFDADPRSFYAESAARLAPWYGAYIDEVEPGHVTMSWSPELLVQVQGQTRAVVTRPIKGTRPNDSGAAQSLLVSTKDRAELAMITDLMRNDLGRVCDFGSV